MTAGADSPLKRFDIEKDHTNSARPLSETAPNCYKTTKTVRNIGKRILSPDP